ncbi:ABC transporter G family member 31 [Phytophthora citrophthora]|uniref:ABC transporter G family member 31 n=1 Tax=Phytophthora citrophthora TaxID=4793 RepID=A0AAD9GKQ9_9STRA|nr:ABC transporter G family member 31 [Phytophthora citrophthora]
MASGVLNDEQPVKSEIGYSSGKALMARGSLALHDHVSTRLDAAFGDNQAQIQVRFQDVSLSADTVVKDVEERTAELPTLPNELAKSFRKFRAKKHLVKKQILKNVSGVFNPGTITLVLGQPGSGKSALMKVLSGRFPVKKNIAIEGEMTFNGENLGKQRKRLPQFVSYVPQHDKHIATLTVKETLEFAHACSSYEQDEKLMVGSPEENEAAVKVERAMVKHLPEVVTQQLGLLNCENTVVGDAMLRGVSGGERKRVTTGEMQFGNQQVVFMDEISTGLDSAAAYDIIATQRSFAKKFNKTVVISLLQPSPEIFGLFDNILILNAGRVMYNGPREDALSYFEGMGFKRPPHRDVADFLMDLGTKKQVQYEHELAAIPRTPKEFAEAFTRSDAYNHLQEDVKAPVLPKLLKAKEQFMDHCPPFYHGFLASTAMLMNRQVKMTVRNTAYLKGRGFMVVVMGLLNGSVYYQLDMADAQIVLGIIFASVMFLCMSQSAQIPTFMASRDVFYKQRGANFYRTASYVWANSVSQLPLAVLESFVYGSMVYWMCGFVPAAGAFLLFELTVILTILAFAAFFLFLSAAAPDLHIVEPISMTTTLFFILFGGFVITKENIPDYLVWLYWLNPVAWCVRSLAVSQYSDSRFDTCKYGDVNYCEKYGMTMGKYSLSLFQVPSETYWIWYGLAFMVVAYVFFMSLSVFFLEYRRFEGPEHVFLDEEDKTMKSSTDGYIQAKTPRNGAPVLLDVSPPRELNFIPVTIAFKDLWYTVADPSDSKGTIDLLKGISGFAEPGTITALMGSSGAGKTTLMDVIAGRKTEGKIQGEILLNGYPATDLAIRRSTGYCEQMDVHSVASTFREALTFSAFLRQGADIPDSTKFDSVTECIDLLDMESIADQIIRGASTEQMKRLTIGVELAAQPSLLFLDEPTSGLDARSAKLIMDGVRKVADTGRTIVCTIHQPSAEVFQVFDSLLLLKRGGESVFFGDLGEDSSKLISYFEGIDGVQKIKSSYNPAAWMLEAIGAGVGNGNMDKTDFVALFRQSEQFRCLQASFDRPGRFKPSDTLPPLEFGDKRASTNWMQMKLLTKRFLDLYWRTASYNLTRFCIFAGLGIIIGITYTGSDYTSYQGINSGMGMMYMTITFVGVISFHSILPIAEEGRASFYRERAAQTYNAFWYFLASSLAEIPYAFAATLLFMVVYYPSVGFSGVGSFFLYWFNMSLHVLLQAYIGEFMMYILPSMEVAAVLSMLLNTVFFLFMGYNPPANSIPLGYKWLYHITPHTYTFAVMASIMFGDCENDSDTGCQVMTGSPPSIADDTTVKGYLEDDFLIKRSELWMNCGIILAFIVFFRLLALLSLRYVNHQKK